MSEIESETGSSAAADSPSIDSSPATFTWEVNAETILVIADVHQNVEWARAVMDREKDVATHTVFLGDFCDTHITPPPSSTKVTAQFYREMIEREDVTVLLGNHDCGVMESWIHNQQFRRKPNLFNACSGFTNGKSIEFNRIVTWDHWKKVRLFALANGWLISHAGFRENFWRPLLSDRANLTALQKDSEHALTMIAFEASPLFAVGMCRGGWAEFGGATWADFHHEFEDNLPFPQLVGHTCSQNVRQIGRSYCIDTGQKTYALIRRDGSIQFKALVKTPVSGTWVEEPVVVQNLDEHVAARHHTTNQNFLQ